MRIKTEPGKKTVKETVNFLEGSDLSTIASYIAGIIRRGNAMDNQLVAKFLTNVRTSKRQKVDRKTKEKSGHRDLQAATKKNMELKQAFYILLSEEMGWSYIKKDGWVDFTGMRRRGGSKTKKTPDRGAAVRVVAGEVRTLVQGLQDLRL
jgi:hypothetical protein